MKKIYEVKVYYKFYRFNAEGKQISRWYYRQTYLFFRQNEAIKLFYEKNRFHGGVKAVLRMKGGKKIV